MAVRWRLKVTTVTGGFALRLIGDGDLGEALDDADAAEVVMDDGRCLPLYDAVLELINARVIGFIVLTERPRIEQPVDDERQAEEWLH